MSKESHYRHSRHLDDEELDYVSIQILFAYLKKLLLFITVGRNR